MLKIDEIVKSTNGKLINGDKDTKIEMYSISSNDIDEKLKVMFIPLKGEKTDGHRYILNAVETGCTAFIVSKSYEEKYEIIQKAKEINKDIAIVEVNETYEALVAMAKYNRDKYPETIRIGVTGSVGKTSTREMLYSVLSQKYNVIKTMKNFNSEYGVPIMLLLNNGYDVAIYEMGMDGAGQLTATSDMVNPDIAVITNVGTSHIGNLGSRENILKAKMEIVNGMKKGGDLYINSDNDMLSKVKEDERYILHKYNLKNNFEILVADDKHTEFMYKEHKYEIDEPGEHNIYNAIVAIEIGIKLKMTYDEILLGVKSYRNFEKRMEKTIIKNNVLIIDDSYNAIIDSMRAGLSIVDLVKDRRKLVILGDMKELGEYSKELHEELASIINSINYDKVFLYGTEIKYTYNKIKDKSKAYYTDNISELEKEILKEMKENDLLYFKASNAMKLGNVIKNISKEY